MTEPAPPGARTARFRRRPLTWGLALALLHGLLLALSFPPFGLTALALVSAAPVMLAALTTDRPARTALGVWLGSLPAWAFLQGWVLDVTLAGYPFMVMTLALYPALFAWLAARVERARLVPAWLALPLVWAGVEFFRGRVAFDGYPWFFVGHPTVGWALGGVASLIGAIGVSLVVALVSGSVAVCAQALLEGVARRPLRLAAPVVGLLALALGSVVGGSLKSSAAAPFVLAGAGAPNVARVAVIQTNLPQDNKIGWPIERRMRDFAEFASMTAEAARAEPAPDLVVWPETMFPGGALNPDAVAAQRAARLAYANGYPTTGFHDELTTLQRELGVPMLVGAHALDGLRIERDPEGVRFEADAEYNSAFLVRGGSVEPERYDKVHLTPFGEVMPYISWSDWLEERLLAIGAPGMAFNLAEGDRATVFEVRAGDGALRFATPICFEATMANVCRRLAYGGESEPRVDALVQLTNDGWFGPYAGGRAQHLQLARWRAIETGVPVVRAANTGVSAVIRPDGAVLKAGPDGAAADVRVAGMMTARLPLDGARATVYGRSVGDLVGWACLAGAGLLAVAALVGRKKVGAGGADTEE